MRIKVIHKAGIPINGRHVAFGDVADAPAAQAEKLTVGGYALYVRDEQKKKEAA